MDKVQEIEGQLTNILHKSAKILNLNNYSLKLNLDVIKGDGFLGEFYKVSIMDNDTDSEVKLVVKKAPTGEIQREISSIDIVYKNEISFYSKIYPEFRRFEEEHQVKNIFDSVPNYVTSVSDPGKELIVLKDITVEGFQLREKQLLLDYEHASFIFKNYGHYHAISFCLKDQQPETYQQITKPLINIWTKSLTNKVFVSFFTKICEQAVEALDPQTDAIVFEKFQKYVTNTEQILGEVMNYRGDNSCIIHGDCWSNNMMFKYEDSESRRHLQAMNLLDFQLTMTNTPVHDLSYFFYTGGSKDLFDKLEYYLDIYYESFSTSVENLGGNPRKLLPREALAEDWKVYSKSGLLLSLMLVKVKLISKEETLKIIEQSNEKHEINDIPLLNIKYDETLFKKRVRDILVHMHEIDAL